MIDFDYSNRPARPSEWVALLKAIRDADPGDETDWLEWKSAIDWANKEQVGGIVARAILGMANRPNPSAALDQSGLIVIGLEAGTVHGVTAIDSADLEAKLRPYLGEDGPAFDPQRRSIDGLDVMTIEVPNPPPGSPIYTLRKQVAKYQEGTIFVRNPGRIDPASSAQVAALVARASSATDEMIDIDITLEVMDPLPHVRVIKDDELEAYLEWERDRLVRSIDVAENNGTGVLMGRFSGENRTVDKFRREVEAYLDEVRRQLPQRLCEFGGSVIPPLVLRVSNLGNGNYPGLHVTLFTDGSVLATDVDLDSGDGLADRLPHPPRDYGTNSLIDLARIDIVSRFQPAESPSRREIENGEHLIVRLAEIELRPEEKRTVIEDKLVFMVPPEQDDPLVVKWEATAGNIKGIARGSFVVPLSDETLNLFRAAIQVDSDNEKRRS